MHFFFHTYGEYHKEIVMQSIFSANTILVKVNAIIGGRT